jgi:hypothetical protein
MVKLVIEVDGGYHDDPEQRAKDLIRDTVLQSHGFRTIRFRNEQVLSGAGAVAGQIVDACKALVATPTPVTAPKPVYVRRPSSKPTDAQEKVRLFGPRSIKPKPKSKPRNPGMGNRVWRPRLSKAMSEGLAS